MQEYLVISAIGEDKPGIINALSQAATDSQCNIQDTRMTVLGGEFALIMLTSGSNEMISLLEQRLPDVARAHSLTTILKRTQPRPSDHSGSTHQIQVDALDHPGIVKEIASFFSDRGLNIEEMETGTYAAPHTGSPMFSLQMVIRIPVHENSENLLQTFTAFCDERNLDANFD